MTDILLNPCGDVDLTDGRLTIVRNADAVKQRWLIYIRTFLAEWFLDQNIGVPYIQRLFKKQLSRQNVKQIFTTASLEVPGILQVPSVVINELNAATRFADITVTCVIDGAEGPETGTFKYTGTIPPDNCGISTAIPPTVDGLLAWFDATAPDSWEYTPGTFRIYNRAGEGFAQNAGGGSADIKILTYTPLGGLPAIRFRGATINEYLLIAGIPALRDTTGYDGHFTIFCVSKLNPGLSLAAAYEQWLFALEGVKNDGVTGEIYNGYQLISTPAYTNPGNGGLGIRSEVIGTAETSPLQAGAVVNPAINDANPSIRVWRIEQLSGGPPDQDRLLKLNDATLLNNTGIKPAKRLLTGNGILGAGFDVVATAAARYFDGYIGEWIFYGRDLTDEETQTITDYLAAKWNIPKSV